MSSRGRGLTKAMKQNYDCLPCLINQVVKVADLVNAPHRELLFQKVFRFLGALDFTQTNPEIIGQTFQLLKEHTGNDDPYKQTREYYDQLFSDLSDTFEGRIHSAPDPLAEAIKYAILGNIIDFNPIHNSSMEHILAWFEGAGDAALTIDHASQLRADIETAHTLLYLGDNCGEICLDKLLIKQLKAVNPALEVFFGVRGQPVVNDIIASDAYALGMDQYATILSNGDGSPGTVLPRTSEAFRRVFQSADVVIAKGQGNYESLSEEAKPGLYFLLVTKCQVIAKDIGVPQQSLICMKQGI